MTSKKLATILAVTMMACSAAEEADSSTSSGAATACESPADASPTGPTSPSGPEKVAGLLDTCKGAYLCVYPGGIASETENVFLRFDGERCLARYHQHDFVLLEDGGVIYEDELNGSWTGDAVAWDLVYFRNGGDRHLRCSPLVEGSD